MNVAARNTRLAKIARPSCTNIPLRAGPDGFRASAADASRSTPAVAIAPTGRRPSTPTAKTTSISAPTPSSST